MYQNDPFKVLTGEVRLSYVHLHEPYTNPKQPNAKAKYTVTLLIPKSDVDTYHNIVNTIQAAYENAVAKSWKGMRPELRSPLIHDGDGRKTDGSPYGAECKGHWVITANSNRKPQVVHISDIRTELAPQDVYSGMYGRVTLNFFSFDNNNRGIGCGLGNVLKTRDGEPLAGGASAEQDFAGIGQTAAPAVPGIPGAVPAAPGYGAAMLATPGEATYPNTGLPGGGYVPQGVPAAVPQYQAPAPQGVPGQASGAVPQYQTPPVQYPDGWQVDPITGKPL